ncbi:MAG: CHAP domain-containing protein, partial [Treponema sp.]|nr:CHAP domain-containing protein [Treponema sp.]
MARETPSAEQFKKEYRETQEKPEGGLPEISDAALDNIYQKQSRQREREEAKLAAEIQARGSQLAGLEERKVNDAGEDVTPGVYRNPDGSLYTRIEDERRNGGVVTGSFRMGDGSRATETNPYGAIDYRFENGVVTITDMNIAGHRTDLTGEFFQQFAKKFSDADIQWNPESEADIAIKEQLTAANRRGPDAGLNYFEPEAVRGETLETQQAKQDFDRQLAEALPRSTAESREGVITLLDRIGNGYGLEFTGFLDRLGFDRKNVFTNTPNRDVLDFNDRAAQYAKDPDAPAARGAMFRILKKLDSDVKAVEYTVVYLDPKAADLSTVVHELKHAVDNFLEQADPELYRRMMAAAGAYDPKSGMDETTWRKERSAYAWENYLQTGEAPTPELRNLFRQMVEWLKDIVNHLSGMRKLTPEQKAVFDGTFGAQCVDEARFYFREVCGLEKQPAGVIGARDFYLHFEKDPLLVKNFAKIPNTPEFVPSPGDLVIWDKSSRNRYGHIAVFVRGDVRSFDSFDQNLPAGSPCHLV